MTDWSICPPSARDTYFIAIDFDGCLCENRFPEIGAPKFATFAKMLLKQMALRMKGKTACFILWTSRSNMEDRAFLTEAVEWCKSYALPITFVNENPLMDFGRPELVKKIFADEYWDDKAVVVK